MSELAQQILIGIAFVAACILIISGLLMHDIKEQAAECQIEGFTVSTAEGNGFDAYLIGKSKLDNPYPPEDEQHEMWLQGYQKSVMERRGMNDVP